MSKNAKDVMSKNAKKTSKTSQKTDAQNAHKEENVTQKTQETTQNDVRADVSVAQDANIDAETGETFADADDAQDADDAHADEMFDDAQDADGKKKKTRPAIIVSRGIVRSFASVLRDMTQDAMQDKDTFCANVKDGKYTKNIQTRLLLLANTRATHADVLDDASIAIMFPTTRRTTLTDAQKTTIIEMYASGTSKNEIGKKTNVHVGSIRRVLASSKDPRVVARLAKENAENAKKNVARIDVTQMDDATRARLLAALQNAKK